MKSRAYFLLIVLLVSTSLSAHSNEFYIEDEYRIIKDELYTRDGKLFFHTTSSCNLNDEDYATTKSIYLKKFYYKGFEVESLIMDLTDVIDPKSWRHLISIFYADNNNLYYYKPDACGGYLGLIEDAEPNDFKVIYGSKRISVEELNIIKSKASCGDRNLSDIDYYYTDGKRVYYSFQVVKTSVATFKTLLDQNYDATDGEYFYRKGAIVRKVD